RLKAGAILSLLAFPQRRLPGLARRLPALFQHDPDPFDGRIDRLLAALDVSPGRIGRKLHDRRPGGSGLHKIAGAIVQEPAQVARRMPSRPTLETVAHELVWSRKTSRRDKRDQNQGIGRTGPEQTGEEGEKTRLDLEVLGLGGEAEVGVLPELRRLVDHEELAAPAYAVLGALVRHTPLFNVFQLHVKPMIHSGPWRRSPGPP